MLCCTGTSVQAMILSDALCARFWALTLKGVNCYHTNPYTNNIHHFTLYLRSTTTAAHSTTTPRQHHAAFRQHRTALRQHHTHVFFRLDLDSRAVLLRGLLRAVAVTTGSMLAVNTHSLTHTHTHTHTHTPTYTHTHKYAHTDKDTRSYLH